MLSFHVFIKLLLRFLFLRDVTLADPQTLTKRRKALQLDRSGTNLYQVSLVSDEKVIAALVFIPFAHFQ